MSQLLPTLLVVDDDEVTRRILQRWLTHLQVQAQVVEAEDGEQALVFLQAFCQAGSFAPQSLLVLLDLKMPVMDGQELLERLPELSPACRQAMAVVALTGTINHSEQQQALPLATEVRIKPLDLAHLRQLIERYIPAALP